MNGFQITTVGIPVQESRLTFNGTSDITKAHIGRAVTIDTTQTNTVKLAGDGDVVLGQLMTVEIETTGEVVVTVWIMGGYRLACATGEVFAVGDTVVGAGEGLVKSGGVSTDLRFFVTEPDTSEGFVGVIKY